MTGLSAFTFADLLSAIDTHTGKARLSGARLAWSRLREEVIHLSGEPSPDEFDPTLDPGLWWLIRVEVAGFRGVTPTGIAFELDPTPGITVIHGLNGAGKSSICDAIDVGLHQTPDGSVKRMEGKGGKQPVWEPVLVNTAGDSSVVTLHLRHDDGRILRIKTEVDLDSATPLASEILGPDNSVRQVQLGQAWRSAVDAYTPTYAYASWEQHIHRASDLRGYLEGMLVLGGCFSAVERAIGRKSEEAHQAYDRVTAAESTAAEAVSALSNVRGRDVPFSMPTLNDDVDEWWQRSGMPRVAAASGQTLELSTDGLRESVERARAALLGLTGTGDDAQLVVALTGLSDIASELDPDYCPVCGTKETWRDQLHSSIEQHQAALKSMEGWQRCLAAVIIDAQLLPELLQAAAPDSHAELTLALNDYQRLVDCRDLRGSSSPATVTAARAFLDRVASREFQAEAEAAVTRCSAEAVWMAALADAVAPLAEVLRGDGGLARESGLWKEVSSKLGELKKQLRKQREDALKSATNAAVAALLEDAGLSVGRLTVLATKADMTLTDATGQTVELGMLSAGQRNAVLLAPALAMAEGGPFGFMIVDDPVHSFDEMRVDFVARQLARIATTRRVVVLTHDERLKEHLLAASPAADSRSIARNPGSGRVTLTSRKAMWEVLLDDATQLRNLPDRPKLKLGLTNTLRGLCRQAFDNALRLFVTREAAGSGSNVSEWLANLDAPGVDRTADRIDAAEKLVKGSPAELRVAACRTRLGQTSLLRDWNRAAHGNDPDTEFAAKEIRDTRAACKALLK